MNDHAEVPKSPSSAEPLPAESVPANTAPGAAASPDTEANRAAGDFPYLDPPQAPGEIGRLADYRVLRVLGQGGMGVVFEAEDPVLGRRVAIKVPLSAAYNDSHRKRFLREARIAATLPHDHIAAVYQAGQQGNVPYMVMELLRGEPLEKRLDREDTLPVAEALRIVRETADGLREAHARGLVHRDLKPPNIWLEERETRTGPPRVKILDFGVAREAQPQQEGITRAGQIVGTVGYMAPEQVLAGNLDARTDLFALGCLLYRMLHGRLPFSGLDTSATLRAVLNDPPELGQATNHLPAAVTELVNDLLRKDPNHRPQNAEIVVERIQHIERELVRTSAVGPPVKVEAEGARAWNPSWGILFGSAVVLLAGLAGIVALARNLMGGGSLPADGSPDDLRAEVPAVPAGPPIKVGVLHSLTGTLASTEAPVAEATLLAFEEINRAGGVLGRPIEWILTDGKSKDEVFAAAAKKLITQDKVVTIFGCWTSSSRKAVAAVCASFDNLLVYPLNYEGLEESPYVIYVGGGPGQQLNPAAAWAVGFLGKRRFFLVGSDYVYSHGSNAILRDQLTDLGAEIVGEEYVSLRKVPPARFGEIAAQIKASKAQAVLNTIDGHQANVAFFHALSEAGVRAGDVPVISFSFSENELCALDERDTLGHYAVANYFESMATPANQDFLKRLKARYPMRNVYDPMEAAYCGAYLWKQAVAEAGSVRPPAIRAAMAHQKFDGPEGLIQIDPETRHALRTARIGQVVANQAFKQVYASPEPLPALPFPRSRTRQQWEEYLNGLYRGWGNHWEAPER